ncbi:MAG: hypothetical protein Q9187_003547, partial [Circinaria calcarea]
HTFELIVSWNGNRAIDKSPYERPDEAWDGLRPAAHDLQAKCQTVNVWTVICNDGECQDHQTELAETTKRWDQHCGDNATDARVMVAFCISRCADRCGHDSETEHFCKAKRKYETREGPGEDSDFGRVDRLVNGIVRRVACPSRCEAKNGGGKAEYCSSFGRACTHRDVAERARVCKLSKDDQENDETGDPRPELVSVNYFVAEKGDNEGCGGNDDNSSPARSWAPTMTLTADQPTQARILKMATSREAKLGSKHGKEADWSDAKDIEEEDG